MDLQAVVIGGGQAGLAVSYELKAREVDHVVLERGQLGESWRSQRWDSFRLNSPGWANALPGAAFPGDRDGFGTAAELVAFFEGYRDRFNLPVRTKAAVSAVRREDAHYIVEAEGTQFAAPSVVVASGIQNVPRIPAIATLFSPGIHQLHAAAYRNATGCVRFESSERQEPR